MFSETERSPRTRTALNSDGIHIPRPKWMVASKHLGDSIIAVALLLFTWPFILLAAVLVKLTSHGPVLYSQTRLGYYGRPFKIYKIRTMYHNCEHLSGPRWSTPGDPRITAVGRFLRRSHIDELPQLWNILKGEMSMVGPRPERPEFAAKLESAIPLYRERLIVRPGVTGLAQVQLPPDSDMEGVRRKLGYDIYYIRQISFWLDCKVVVSTCLKVSGFRFVTLRRWFRFPEPECVRHEMEQLVPEETPLEETSHSFQYQPVQL